MNDFLPLWSNLVTLVNISVALASIYTKKDKKNIIFGKNVIVKIHNNINDKINSCGGVRKVQEYIYP